MVDFYQFSALLNDADSVDSAIKKLHSHKPELFDLYMLGYHSRSLQGSSPTKPRAIVFDPSGHLVFSFNGDDDQRGGNAIEVMRFLPEERKFEFREIVFHKGESPSISEANPPKCMVCHQGLERATNDPRPNWEPYNFWPGFYGSADGFLGVTRSRLRNPDIRNDDFLVQGIESEQENLKTFLEEVKPTHPRYQFLAEFEPRLTVDFTELMARRNFERIYRMMTLDHPAMYKSLEPTILGVLKCGRLMVDDEDLQWIRQQLPEREPIYRDQRLSEIPAPTKHEVRETMLRDQMIMTRIDDAQFESLVESVYQNRLKEHNDYMRVDISEALYNLYEPFGISTKDWSMDFRTQGRFAAVERFGTPSNTQARFRDAVRDFLGARNFNDLPGCDELRELSPKAFSEFRRSPMGKTLLERKYTHIQAGERPLIRRCQ
ncbi:MAG: hypothetical protein AAF202_11495, partial [Pseudomonadota bacterium]